MKHGEDALHKIVWQYLGYALPQRAVRWSTENRNLGPREGARRKARGCVAGVPDILIYLDKHLYGIELKMPGNYPTPCQKIFHAALERNGADVTVCRSLAEVDQFLAGNDLLKSQGEKS